MTDARLPNLFADDDPLPVVPFADIDSLDGRLRVIVNRWVLPEHRDTALRELRELIHEPVGRSDQSTTTE